MQTDARLREGMNWDDEATISLDRFLVEWQRASADSSYHPTIGDSGSDAAGRFLAALADIEEHEREGVVVVVAHGGVTVDSLRALVGDEAVRSAGASLIDRGIGCCAITKLRVDDGVATVIGYPSTTHLGDAAEHRPA